MAKKVPEINSSSQADIAFLLLCFFLMTTSMDTDYGLIRRLPPPVENNDEDIKVKTRNVMNVLINKNDKLMVTVNGKTKSNMKVKDLKDEVKYFMTPHPGDESAPEVDYKPIPGLPGDIPMSKGVISLQNDRGTSYEMYLSVQDALAAAFREMRDDMALKHFGKKFDQLNEDQTTAISTAVPLRISEAEPVEK